jgi:hypothetical protein
VISPTILECTPAPLSNNKHEQFAQAIAVLGEPTRTAVYGPARTVVWQGSATDRRPCRSKSGNSSVTPITWRMGGQPFDSDGDAGRKH